MPQFVVNRIENFIGNQVIIWLEEEHTGKTEDERGLSYCVRVPVGDAPRVMQEMIAAYVKAMENTMVHVAAGGCRTCHNKRFVNGEPCPVCIPRAEKRVQNYGKGF